MLNTKNRIINPLMPINTFMQLKNMPEDVGMKGSMHLLVRYVSGEGIKTLLNTNDNMILYIISYC